jgi:hypothetical protein
MSKLFATNDAETVRVEIVTTYDNAGDPAFDVVCRNCDRPIEVHYTVADAVDAAELHADQCPNGSLS